MANKTIQDHFESMEDKEASEKAIENTLPQILIQSSSDLHESLLDAFNWDETPEGHNYWWNVLTKIEK